MCNIPLGCGTICIKCSTAKKIPLAPPFHGKTRALRELYDTAKENGGNPLWVAVDRGKPGGDESAAVVFERTPDGRFKMVDMLRGHFDEMIERHERTREEWGRTPIRIMRSILYIAKLKYEDPMGLRNSC